MCKDLTLELLRHKNCRRQLSDLTYGPRRFNECNTNTNGDNSNSNYNVNNNSNDNNNGNTDIKHKNINNGNLFM